MNKHTVKVACVAAAALTALTGCGAGKTPSTNAAVAPTATATTQATPSTPVASSRPAGITGTLYYYAPFSNRALGRLSGGKLVSVISADRAGLAVVSPDGTKVAYIEGTTLWVTDSAGANGKNLGSGFNNFGWEPTWSPTGDRLLVAKGPEGVSATPGIVTVATGAFVPLAHNPNGIHYLWSADGKHIGYATEHCRIGIADLDGGNARVVPGVESCDPFSISPDGTKIAVDVIHPGDDAGDIAPNLVVDAIIDTTSGKSLPIPVTGEVRQLLFLPDGGMLVRAKTGSGYTLTLFGADGGVFATAAEAAKLDAQDALVAYV